MLLSLFLFFLKLGFVSFGGGYPMMSFILEEGQRAVGLTAGEFADMAALELLASGPIAINAATYVGFIKGGFLGALAATAGVCVPGFILAGLLYSVLKKFQHNPYVQGFIGAIKIACGGILMTAALNLGKNIFLFDQRLSVAIQNPGTNIQWGGVLIAGICVVAMMKFKVNAMVMILVSAVLGVLLL